MSFPTAPTQQQVINGFGTAVVSSTLTATAAGALIVAEFTSQLASGTSTSVTDNIGNTYTLVLANAGVAQRHVEIWACLSATAGVTAVTVNNAAGTNVAGTVTTWLGGAAAVSATNSLDNGSSANPPAATVTPAIGALIIGNLGYIAGTASTRQETLTGSFTGLTAVTRGTTTMHASAYLIATSTTATGPTWTMSPGVSTGEATAVFTPNGSGSGTTVTAVPGTATADGQAPVVTVTTVVSGGGPGTATAAGIAPTVLVDPNSVVVIPAPVVYLNSSRASLGSLNFGMVEPSGVAWVLGKVQGWGSPSSTAQVTQKPRSHGGWAGPGYLPARVVTLNGTVDAPTTDLLTDALDRLSEACSLTDTTLAVVEASRVRTMLVRRQGEVLTDAISDLAANWSVQVVALDPRKYGLLTSQSTTLPSSSGGRTWPAVWPAVWSGVANSGTVTIRNEGNIAAPVVIRIDGPVVAPSVTRISETGDTKVLAFALTLAAGEFLLINTDPSVRSVLANGQSSRSGYLTSRGWFLAEKGVNTYGFNAQVFNSTAQMTVTVPTGAWS